MKKTLITPEMAKAILKENEAVAKFVGQMQDGTYELTAQPIVLDGEGRLVDGAKRLLAD